MEDLEYGPVELLLAGFTGDKPSTGVLDALADLSDAGTIRVIDLVAGGLASEDDVAELGSRLPPGAAAMLVVLEHVWAKRLASRLLDADGFVVDAVRIPAPVVNLVALEAAEATLEEEVS